VKATVKNGGELVQLIENLASASGGELPPALVDAREALDAALAENHPDVSVTLLEAGRSGNTVSFSGDDFFYQDPTVTRVAIPMDDDSLQEGYLVETWSDDDNLLNHTVVGGDGQVLSVELRSNNDNYNIFPDHPGNSSQTSTPGPGAGNAESPSGWLNGSQTTINMTGNNVHAYLDRDNNGSADAGGSPVSDGNFLTVADLTQDPTIAQNQAVAVQNLFYMNNIIHDKLYSHGFVEAVGNFQEDNFSNGGSGSDSVRAEAQDGGSTNNANFSTPSDGFNPRMQMYLWTRTTPRRDGDVDSDIVWHEYGHGLTWRMIGGMSGSMSGAIGEGMSDVLAILSNDDDRVGEYSYNTSNGIRSRRYSGYSSYRTYGNFTGGAAIWRVWELFQADSIPQADLFDYVVDGMNYTASGPAMEDMRDGILQSAAGSGHECVIWEGFAELGIGEGASYNGGKVTESFDLPAACTGGPTNTAPTASFTQSCDDATLTCQFTDTSSDPDSGDAVDSWSWNFGDPDSDANHTSSSQNPSHTFSAAGDYSVSLMVTDMGSPEVSDSTNHNVSVGTPTGGGSGSVKGSTRSLSGGKLGGVLVSVDIGPGSGPSATSNNGGKYNIASVAESAPGTPWPVIATKDGYCMDGSPEAVVSAGLTTTVNIDMNPGVCSGGAPTASFTYSCNGLECSFTDTSTDSIVSFIAEWDWDFGDSSSGSTAQNPSHTFDAAGTYTVGLTVMDNEGTGDSTSQNVTVGSAPTGSGSVKGSTRSNTGARLGGVLVIIDTNQSPDPSATSNNGSKYNVSTVDAGTWPVNATKAGYCMVGVPPVLVNSGATTTVDITMSTGACATLE
jgi:PKD repeat protein